MSDTLFPAAGSAGVSLTDRQAHALTIIEGRQPIRSDALGAELHAYRQANGGKGHSADTFCDFCISEGRSVGDALKKKGLVSYVRGDGWTVAGADTNPATSDGKSDSSTQIGVDDPWPEDMY